jgi:hypothetical protein
MGGDVGGGGQGRLAALASALWPVALGLAVGVGAAARGVPREQVALAATAVTVAVYLGVAAVVALALIAVPPRRGPIILRTVTVMPAGIVYVPRDGERVDIPWSAIARIAFSRSTHVASAPPWEATGDDAEWIFVLDRGRVVRIPVVAHSPLLDGLRANLGALDEVALRTALDAPDAGSWAIWERPARN